MLGFLWPGEEGWVANERRGREGTRTHAQSVSSWRERTDPKAAVIGSHEYSALHGCTTSARYAQYSLFPKAARIDYPNAMTDLDLCVRSMRTAVHHDVPEGPYCKTVNKTNTVFPARKELDPIGAPYTRLHMATAVQPTIAMQRWHVGNALEMRDIPCDRVGTRVSASLSFRSYFSPLSVAHKTCFDGTDSKRCSVSLSSTPGQNRCVEILAIALDQLCHGGERCWNTSTLELQLVSLEICGACRRVPHLHVRRVDEGITHSLLARREAQAAPDMKGSDAGALSRVPVIRALRLTWELPLEVLVQNTAAEL